MGSRHFIKGAGVTVADAVEVVNVKLEFFRDRTGREECVECDARLKLK